MYGLRSRRAGRYDGPTSPASPTTLRATEDMVSSPFSPVSESLPSCESLECRLLPLAVRK